MLVSRVEEKAMTNRSRLAALMVTAALAGLSLGAHTALGASPRDVERAAPVAGASEPDRLRGTFWRPAGSDAVRPTVSVRRVAWTPPETAPRHLQPDAIDSVQAVVRLASLD
jgi:hypothetical protein